MPNHNTNTKNAATKQPPARIVPVQTSPTKPNTSQPSHPPRGAVKQLTNHTTTNSTSNTVPPVQQPQQPHQRWLSPRNAGLPVNAVWGKQRPASEEPRTLPNPSSQPSIHAAKPVNIVNNNNNNNQQHNNNNKSQQSQPIGSSNKESIRILQKKQPEAANQSKGSKAPSKDQVKPKGSTSTATKAKAQPKPSKATKNKPQLQSMSLGDKIVLKPTNPPMNNPKGRQQQQQQQQQQSRSQPNHKKPPPVQPNMDLTKDFPSLSRSTATSQTSSQSTSLLAKSTWGKATGVSKANNNQQQQQPPPTTTSSTILLASKGLSETPIKECVSSNNLPNKRSTSTTADTSTTISASKFFQPKTEILRDGEEHKLLRLLQERNVYQKKGRQRLHLRKKKFSALKKKVLQERLQKWRALHPSPEDTNDGAVPRDFQNDHNMMSSSSSLCVYNYVHAEELEDEDEYQEIMDNLQEFASKVGAVQEIFIPRMERTENYPVFVRFESSKDASAALACWEGLVVGGEHLHVKSIPDIASDPDLDWKERVLLSESSSSTAVTTPDTTDGEVITISLAGILTDDDYDDEDCMIESLQDLRAVATKCGSLMNLQASDERDGRVLITYLGKAEQAGYILQRLQEWTIGGKQLSPTIVSPTSNVSDDEKCIVLLDNILTEDDLEDEDCLAETLSDIRELVGHHGNVLNVEVVDNVVQVTYQGNAMVAQAAATAINGMKLGGMSISARVMVASSQLEEGLCMFLYNILCEDDMDDEDCLQESLNDIRTLASKHGRVKDLEVLEDEGKHFVKVTYEDADHARDSVQAALAEINGMVVGGSIVKATASLTTPSKENINREGGDAESDITKRKKDSEEDNNTKKARTENAEPVKPLYSGDKLIPERFAEAKRVPKIPNAPGPREYAKAMNDEQVKPLLIEMLGELMRLQKRAVEENNTKAKRRLVMGLREVARGIRSHKVKMVIMANNLDEYGAIDAKLQEIIELARNEEVPLFFEFTKKNLGKALGKTIKIAVVGVQNADGAHQPFKKLVALASKI